MVSPVLKEIHEYEAAQHVRRRIEQMQEAQQGKMYVVGTAADMQALEERLKREAEDGLEA